MKILERNVQSTCDSGEAPTLNMRIKRRLYMLKEPRLLISKSQIESVFEYGDKPIQKGPRKLSELLIIKIKYYLEGQQRNCTTIGRAIPLAIIRYIDGLTARKENHLSASIAEQHPQKDLNGRMSIISTVGFLMTTFAYVLHAIECMITKTGFQSLADGASKVNGYM